MDSRTKNGTRNIISGVINRIVLLLFPFITRTLIINILGSGYLGLNSLFTSILTVLNLSELGFGSALVYTMYKPVAEGDETKICALLALYKKIYHIIGIVICAVGLGILPFIPNLINGTWPDGINIYIIYIIYLGNTSISYFAFAHKKALLTAYQRSDLISNINSIISIVSYIVQIVLLIVFRNYYIYIFVLPIFTIIENMWVAVVTKKMYPNIVCKGKVLREELKDISNHVKGIALQKICSTSRNSFDSVVISMYLGLSTIAMYGNYYYIMSSIHAFLYQIPNAIRASVGNSVTSENLGKNHKDFQTMNYLYMWLSGWCFVCLMCLYQPFMKIWMGTELMFPMQTVILFCIYFYELSMSDIIALYKDGAGLWWHGRYRTIVEAIANLALNFLLGWLWGVNGILVATILTMALIGIGYGGYIVFQYYFGIEKFSKYLLAQGAFFAVTAFVSFITWRICGFIPDVGFETLILKGLICIILPNGLFWIVYSRFPSYSSAKSLVQAIATGLIKKGRK